MFWKYKEKTKKEWELFFAFFPTPVGKFHLTNGQKIIWLEFMERRFIDSYEGKNYYEYRERVIK